MREDAAMREIRRFVETIPPPHPSLRARAMAAVPPADARPQRRLGWAAAVAVLLAVVVVGTLLLGIRTGAPIALPGARPTPRPASPPPTARPASGQLDVPDSTPVMVLGSRSAAITWTGERGTLPVLPRLDAQVNQSPDGSRFLVGSGTVVDRSGTAVGDIPVGGVEWPVWADDSRHLCSLFFRTGSPGPTELRLLQPGQPAHDVAQVGTASYRSTGPNAHVEACSVRNDRAVVSEASESAVEVWLVQLSSGRVLRHETYPVSAPTTPGGQPGSLSIRVSRDASLIAVMGGPFSPAGAGLTATIVRLADGAVMARLDNSVVLAFSWDGALAVTAPGYEGAPSVVRWRTGEVLWTGQLPFLNTPLPEPDGTRLAVGTHGGDIWLVGPDGHAVLAASGDLVPVVH